MTDTPQNTTGAYDLLGERRQEGISFAPASSGTGLKVSPKTRENFGRSAAPQDKPQADTAVAAGPGGYDQQNFFVKFLINILMMLTGKLDADNKGNNSLIGLISKAFGMNDDADHTEFRQLQGDLKTRGRETVRRERDYSRFDTGAAVAAAKMGEPILGKNIYNSQMLELIGKGESGSDYNRVFAHKGVKRVDLTNMTLNQVMDWQRSETNRQAAEGYAPGQRSSAAGKYQFMCATLAETAREMGLSGNEKFDPAMQDRLAMHLLKKRGYDAFLKGQISESEMVNRVSGTWAAIKKTNGAGTYDGDGINRGTISASTAIAAGRMDQTILASSFSGASTGAPRPPATTNPIVVADGGKPSTSTTFAAASAGTQPAAAAAPVVNVAAAVVESAQNNARRQQPAGATLG